MKMLYHIAIVVCFVASWASACDLRDDLSPFFWKNSANVCTKELCQVYDYLKCDVAREYIEDQAMGHYPEDILYEVEQMKKYFDTFIPQPTNTLPYNCKGICQKGAGQLQLQRIFTTVNVREHGYANLMPKHMMCIVIGPNIYYEQCGGKCDVKNNFDRYCVPDVTVKLKLWVFCPDVEPGCHKVDFDVPLSCTCKKLTCKRGISLPPLMPLQPNIPVAPPNWVPNPNPGVVKPIHPLHPGQPLGPLNPGTPLGPLNPGTPLGPLHPGTPLGPPLHPGTPLGPGLQGLNPGTPLLPGQQGLNLGSVLKDLNMGAVLPAGK